MTAEKPIAEMELGGVAVRAFDTEEESLQYRYTDDKGYEQKIDLLGVFPFSSLHLAQLLDLIW